MQQSRLHSLIEAFSQVFIGYLINVGVGVLVFPLFGATFTLTQNFGIGLVFLVVALIRSYIIRRYFNRKGKA